MMSAVCAVSAHSLRPKSRRLNSPIAPPSPTPSARVDKIRQQHDLQRQQWEEQITARCSKMWRHSNGSTNTLKHKQSTESDTDSTDSEKENQDIAPTGPALRLVSSDHVTKSSGVTWTVTYDIQDFLKDGSVEVHCDPEGIVITACLDSSDSGSGSLKRNSDSKAKLYKETFMIASVDHSSLRVKSKANGLMKITVSSRPPSARKNSKRLRAS